jgi:hypothetical protein
MGKYHVTWECDPSRLPLSPKERAEGWNMLIEMVKQDIKKGILKDWGCFPGEINGYCIAEGTEVEVHSTLVQYYPFVVFTTKPIASVGQVDEVIKALAK